MSDPEFQPQPGSHRDDISDDETTILAAPEILENALPTTFRSTIEKCPNDHPIKPQESYFRRVSSEEFSELLLKLKGLDLFEHEVVVNHHLIDLAVSSISEFQLSETVQRAIREHEGLAKLHATYADGKGLVIRLHGLGRDMQKTSRLLGEIQTDYVAKVLKIVFSQAVFTDVYRPALWEHFGIFRKQVVSLMVKDMSISAHVQPAKKTISGSAIIPIEIVKPANGLAERLRDTRTATRAHLGLSSEHRVLSIYVDSITGVREGSKGSEVNPSAEELVDQVSRQSKAQIVFLSGTVRRGANEEISMYQNLPYFDNFIPLSTLSVESFRESVRAGKRIFVFNDTRGKLPFLHSIADLVFVRGPVNLHEGLTVGTPTLIYNNSETLGNYRPAGYSKMEDVALATGGAVAIANTAELRDGVQRTLNLGRDFTPPYLSSSLDSPNALTVFLDELYSVFARELHSGD